MESIVIDVFLLLLLIIVHHLDGFNLPTMCYLAFLGADQALDTAHWTQEGTFYVSAHLSEEQQRVLKDKLEHPFVYIIETFEGCECKFQYNADDYDLSDRPKALLQELDLDQLQKEQVKHEASIVRLLNLLRHACADGSVSLYFAWFDELDQPIAVEETLSLGAIDFPERYWRFEDNKKIVFTA